MQRDFDNGIGSGRQPLAFETYFECDLHDGRRVCRCLSEVGRWEANSDLDLD
jgi:hypothetical protein